MIFEYADRVHDLPIEITDLTDRKKHWLVFELPTKDEMVRKLIELSDPEAEECLILIHDKNRKDEAEHFKAEVYMCCYFLWQTPYVPSQSLRGRKYTSLEIAQKVEVYARNRGWKPDVISPLAWDVAASCKYYTPRHAKWTQYKVYAEFSQTSFPV